MIRVPLPNEMTIEEFYSYAKSYHKLDFKPNKKYNGSLVMTGSDFKNKEKEKKPFIVEQLFKEGEFILISGGPKAGKSWFAIDLSLLIAHGGSMGQRISASKPHKILYVDSEMNIEEVEERIDLLETLYEKNNQTANNFGYLPVKKYKNQINLSLNDDQQWVENEINNHDAKIIIFDNLKGLLQDGRLKHEENWGPFNRWIGSLIGSSKRKTVLLVHHEDDSGEIRGTKTIQEDVHLLISLNNPTLKTIEETGLKTISEIHFKCPRHLYGKSLSPFSIEYITEKDESTGQIVNFQRLVNVDLKNKDKQPEYNEVHFQREFTDDIKNEIFRLELNNNQKEIALKIYTTVRVSGKNGIKLLTMMRQMNLSDKKRSTTKIILKKLCDCGLLKHNEKKQGSKYYLPDNFPNNYHLDDQNHEEFYE